MGFWDGPAVPPEPSPVPPASPTAWLWVQDDLVWKKLIFQVGGVFCVSGVIQPGYFQAPSPPPVL